MTKANLHRLLEGVGGRALQTSTMPCEIRVEFCHARDGRPAGTSVFGSDGQMVRLEQAEGREEGRLVKEEEQRGSESDGRISGPATIAGFPAELRCLFHASRYKIIYGGRGSGKSWSVARTLLLRGTQKCLRILCGREFQNSIADSVHRLLADQIELLQLSGFYTVGKSSIVGANGTEFRFAGIRHNISKLKSFDVFDIVWIEEGQTVSKNSFDVLIPTIRKAGSEIWSAYHLETSLFRTYISAPAVFCSEDF